MVTEVFVMCDGANDSHGKLNILGAFDMIVADDFPFVHPHCSIAVRLRHGNSDGPEQKINLILKNDADNAPLASVDTTLKRAVSPNPTSTSNLIIHLNSLRFEKPGDYSIVLKVDGLPVAITPLYVRPSSIGAH